MPLRDHFRPPLTTIASWEELHGGWPTVIVQPLRKQLPPGYVAGPRVHFGAQVEIDVATSEKGATPPLGNTELPDEDEYEVRIYDAERGRTLVAALEIVSPTDKDRPEKRNAFVGKCAALLRNGGAVRIVDLVTIRQFNLYAGLMTFLGHPDPTLGPEPPSVYAASCRWRRMSNRAVLETWKHALIIG